MLNWLLGLFGYEIVYVCDWGTYRTRYGAVDQMMTRPIHKDMSTAPPWASAKVVRTERIVFERLPDRWEPGCYLRLGDTFFEVRKEDYRRGDPIYRRFDQTKESPDE